MPKKVLIVDDSGGIRRAIVDLLSPAGYEVLEARDGVEGADTIERVPDLSLVICDLTMPRMGGLEMLGQVKADGKNADLLVLMLTTEGRVELIREAKQSGACGWLVKPVDPEALLATIRKLIGS